MNAERILSWCFRVVAAAHFVVTSWLVYLVETHGIAYPDITVFGHTFSSQYLFVFVLVSTAYQTWTGRITIL